MSGEEEPGSPVEGEEEQNSNLTEAQQYAAYLKDAGV
eukprot:gene24504-10497_t